MQNNDVLFHLQRAGNSTYVLQKPRYEFLCNNVNGGENEWRGPNSRRYDCG